MPVNWGGAASGAIGGASAGAALGPIGAGVGALAGGLMGMFGGGKSQAQIDEENRATARWDFLSSTANQVRGLDFNDPAVKQMAQQLYDPARQQLTAGMGQYSTQQAGYDASRGMGQSGAAGRNQAQIQKDYRLNLAQAQMNSFVQGFENKMKALMGGANVMSSYANPQASQWAKMDEDRSTGQMGTLFAGLGGLGSQFQQTPGGGLFDFQARQSPFDRYMAYKEAELKKGGG